MAITFKSTSANKPLAEAQTILREKLQLPDEATVAVGANMSTITLGNVSLTVPLGFPHLKNEAGLIDDVREDLSVLTGYNPLPAINAGAEFAAPFDPASDEAWVQGVASTLFPAAVPLYAANELHSLVHGTSGGSVYRVCFVGPELRGACRIKTDKVSFRFTTKHNTCPDGDMKTIIERLGVTNVYDDRMTVHASMSGPIGDYAHEYRMLFGAMYAGLRPYLTSPFPSIEKLAEGVI